MHKEQNYFNKFYSYAIKVLTNWQKTASKLFADATSVEDLEILFTSQKTAWED